jgi:hypothetical protein
MYEDARSVVNYALIIRLARYYKYVGVGRVKRRYFGGLSEL